MARFTALIPHDETQLGSSRQRKNGCLSSTTPSRNTLLAFRWLRLRRYATLKKEGAEQIGSLVQESRMRWIWVPLPDGNPPRVFPNGIVQIENALHEGASVLIHCSAGMHRTGMIALSVLRRTGMTEEKALDLIQAM